MTRDSQGVDRGSIQMGDVLNGLAAFFGLVAVIPLAWELLVPLDVNAWARWVYLASAVAVACLVATRGQPQRRRRSAAMTVGILLLVVGACTTFDAATSGFSQTTTEARVVSPHGRLVAAQLYLDQGALGGDSLVKVQGRFIPGLLTWDYEVPIPDDAYPESIKWRDDRTVVVDREEYPIPEYIVRLSW